MELNFAVFMIQYCAKVMQQISRISFFVSATFPRFFAQKFEYVFVAFQVIFRRNKGHSFSEYSQPKRKFAIMNKSSSVIREISEAIEQQVASICGKKYTVRRSLYDRSCNHLKYNKQLNTTSLFLLT